MGFDSDIGHARISVDCPHCVSYCLILLSNRQVTLIILRPIPLRIHGRGIAGIKQEFGQLNILLALSAAFHIVDETAKSHQPLFYLLVAVVPRFFGRATEIVDPAVGQFLGAIV